MISYIDPFTRPGLRVCHLAGWLGISLVGIVKPYVASIRGSHRTYIHPTPSMHTLKTREFHMYKIQIHYSVYIHSPNAFIHDYMTITLPELLF